LFHFRSSFLSIASFKTGDNPDAIRAFSVLTRPNFEPIRNFGFRIGAGEKKRRHLFLGVPPAIGGRFYSAGFYALRLSASAVQIVRAGFSARAVVKTPKNACFA
jgi:hypothetical protein